MGKFSFLTAIFLLVFGLSYAQHNQDHSGHDHSGHDHSGHDHSGHDHSGHDHSGHDHSGHDHGKKEKKVLKRNSKKLQQQRAGNSHEGHDHAGHDHTHGANHTNACGIAHEDPTTFNAAKVAFHHISDQNIYSIGPWHFPLPCI